MMGEEKSSLAWLVIAILAAMIVIGVWFVTPEFREEVLKIPEKREIKEKTVNVNKMIGKYNASKEIFRHDLTFFLKFSVKEEKEDSGIVELSSNIFKISKKEIHIPEKSYILIKPLKVDGILEISYDGNKEALGYQEKKIFGPSKVVITNKLGLFQFFGTSIINYTIYRITEEPLYPSKEINFRSDIEAESSTLKLSFSGNCDLKIYVNGKKIFDGRLLEDTIDVGKLQKGDIKIRFLANRGCDCEIDDLELILHPPEVSNTYEVSFGKISGERIKILLDIEEKGEKAKIYLTFLGKNYYTFNLTNKNSAEVDGEDLADVNTIRIKVEDGYIFLKRIKIVGE